jgi:hypothetical protein
VFLPWSADDYVKGKKWVKEVEKHSVVMSEDWLKSYKEAPLVWSHGPKGSKKERGWSQRWFDLICHDRAE